MTEYRNLIKEIDDPTNRIGFVVLTHDLGEIRENANDYYVWPTGSRRGFRTISFDSACEWLKIPKPVGWADYKKTRRLGRMIDKTAAGEIWKEGNTYYVWVSAGEGCCVEHYLSRARAWIEIKERA